MRQNGISAYPAINSKSQRVAGMRCAFIAGCKNPLTSVTVIIGCRMTLNQVISGYQQLNSGLRRWQYDPQRTEHCQRNGEQHDAASVCRQNLYARCIEKYMEKNSSADEPLTIKQKIVAKFYSDSLLNSIYKLCTTDCYQDA